jgi:Tfp pilus assembly protein PilN
MANASILKLTALLVLILGLTLFPTPMLRSNAQQKRSQDALAKRQQLLDRSLLKIDVKPNSTAQSPTSKEQRSYCSRKVSRSILTFC